MLDTYNWTQSCKGHCCAKMTHRICSSNAAQQHKAAHKSNIYYFKLTFVTILCIFYMPCAAQYTLSRHFIRYTLQVLVWTPICLQNCLNSTWQSLVHGDITALHSWCHQLNIYDVTLLFHHIPQIPVGLVPVEAISV